MTHIRFNEGVANYLAQDKIVLLSKISGKWSMNAEEIVNYCLEYGYSEICNDYGYGITVGLDEIERVWETWRYL
jgi:hypothetical protein